MARGLLYLGNTGLNSARENKTRDIMNINKLRVAIVASTLMLGAALPAQAALMTWTLSGVQFSDGTTATGSLIMDSTTRNYTSFSVSTFEGTLSQFTYNDSNSGLYFGGGAGPNNFILFTDTGERYFNFSFAAPLDSLGGKFALFPATSYECMNCGTFRMITAGSLTTLDAAEIPEPSTGALLLPALAMMGWMARRRKQRAAK